MSVCFRCAFRYGFRPAFTPSFTNSIRFFSTTSSRPAETPEKPSADPKPKALSSVAAGTQLKGINYINKLSDPIALPDEEYPAWLWTVLEDRRPQLNTEPQLSAEDAADLFSKSKGRRKMAQKRIAEKQAANEGQLAVPSDWRTDDMPFETYEESQKAIMEAKKASRARRRAAIKERNFLGKLK
ncbi:hypothetical protein Dda_1890 [Drechslerella dactyloides]|uniref:Large ribosomal subunit protein mL54 n=1 Tax=Drechslerella dactyloides TaxID=74499 RepID=A0AAD6J3X2_DREDA|nr:hypothetical protein Dda_1890 [Drechslerella dactyloides]